MSRIGKKPVTISNGVKVTANGTNVEVQGPKGKLAMKMTGDVDIAIENNEVVITRKNDLRQNRALHGLYRALIQNMVTGVSEGFTKKLELVGIGYRAEVKGNTLIMQLGYSHPVILAIPGDLKIETPTQNTVVLTGADKQLVGLVAAKIRSFREPEPYKGKGIKYDNEVVRRKAGKTAGK